MMKRILLLSCLALLAVAGRVQAQTATIDGITYTANDDGQTAAVTYAGRDITEATIPATVNIDGTDYPVTAIGDNAFNSCLDLQIVTLPKGLQSIGYRAFFGCRALQSVTFPEGLQSIGNQAFYYCSALESITLPEGLQTIGREAFYGCNALQSIILPQGLQSIGTATFGSCTALQSITFPEGLQSIDEWAFLSCSALQSVTFPEGLRSIGGNAFTSCPLKDITCHAATPPIIEDYTFNYDTYGTAVLTVPEGAEATYRAAEHWAWFYDSMAENQEDGQGTAAVYAERTITAAHIPATVNIDGTDYPVTAIGDNAFSYCDALQSIDLPEGLQTIGYRAFSYCDALQSVTFPDGLQTIGGVAFFTCTALQSIILPQGLQSIGYNAFSYCDALQSITLPEGLQTIGNQAFYGCSALQSVTLPDGLQSIDLSAFSKCPLLNINSLAAIPPAINNNTFDYSTYGTAVLTVPEGAEATYRAAEHWAWFYDSMAENIKRKRMGKVPLPSMPTAPSPPPISPPQ